MERDDYGVRRICDWGAQMITLLLTSKLFRYAALAGLLGLLLLGAFLYFRVRRSPMGGIPTLATAILPANDKEQLIVDPHTHSLIVKQPGHTTATSLPNRPTVIDVHKDGSVTVTSRQYGPEFAPFLGLYFSERQRLAVGVDVFYYKKLDVGVGVAFNAQYIPPVVFGSLSYNVWSNCSVGIAYGSNRYLGGLLTVRL